MPSSERLDVLWQHHNEIIEAITRKDSKQAKQKIIDHLNFIEEKIKKIWERSRIDNK
jgi:DNA-binding FadR family transcriptional regulator